MNSKTVEVLNRLLRTVYRSLPEYVQVVHPWMKNKGSEALDLLRRIADDDNRFACRLAETIQSRAAGPSRALSPSSSPTCTTSRWITYSRGDPAAGAQPGDDRMLRRRFGVRSASAGPDPEPGGDRTADTWNCSTSGGKRFLMGSGPLLVDTHAHLDAEEFAADRDAVIARARQAGVTAILCPGITADSSAAVVRLAEAEGIYAAVGIQPNYCQQAAAGDWDRIVSLAGHARVVALGETGLDRHWDFTPFDVQQDYFKRHLRLGQSRDLPVIIHCREAEADLLPMLRQAAARGPLRAVLHAFSGDRAFAEECLALGLFLSFCRRRDVQQQEVRAATRRGRGGARRSDPDRDGQPLSDAAPAPRQGAPQRAGPPGAHRRPSCGVARPITRGDRGPDDGQRKAVVPADVTARPNAILECGGLPPLWPHQAGRAFPATAFRRLRSLARAKAATSPAFQRRPRCVEAGWIARRIGL